MSELIIDEDWLKQLSEGTNEAYEKLFATYWPRIYSLVHMLVKSDIQAEDLTQDIFIKIWNNKEELPQIRNLDAYIYTVARNASLDFLKKRVLVTDNLENLIINLRDDALGPEQQLVYKDLKNCLRDGIDALPVNIREVFILSRYEGLSHEEIAVQLGISVYTSKTYVVRGLKALRLYIRHHAQVQSILLAFLILNRM
ncbi:RNA polymerase sigma factor [Sphingobacterium tabacisoli]|uniref:RNA polymerase sigma factor n=1 Tax=Sphingobacterium tabacisoli TaxID=2044855 RepID=A0ABW5L4T3_9SPHI|nr:RNA polymerase sigma-70 factor [Sphingobacterium tabacisoli]